MSIDGYTRAWVLAAQRAVHTNNKGLAEFALKKALDGPCRDAVSCNPEPDDLPRSAFTGGDKE